MANASDRLSIEECCIYYKIERTFIESLDERGLIHIQENQFITYEELNLLEKFICFHYDLDINLEGIEAIHHLLEHINNMTNEIQLLKNRLTGSE